jgi:integrase
MRLHDLRHSWVTLLLELGHRRTSSVTMTINAHASLDEKQAALKRLKLGPLLQDRE